MKQASHNKKVSRAKTTWYGSTKTEASHNKKVSRAKTTWYGSTKTEDAQLGHQDAQISHKTWLIRA